MKKAILFFSITFCANILSAQITSIPDNNFEQALIDIGLDDVLDGSVLTDNINNIASLVVTNASISDLSGIQDFAALTTLYCNDNLLTNLDLSSNSGLVDLRCQNNQLSSLVLSNNEALDALNCSSNQLTNLVLSDNSALSYLDCHGNQFVALVVDNQALGQLICYDNPLLTTLYCNDNQLTTLDLSTNIALDDLRCNSNQLTSLDLSANVALDAMNCGNNQLSTLDLSALTALTYISCRSNQLTTLDLSNGNNTNINYLDAGNNPLLLCIEVDDVAWSDANWSDAVDSQSYFSIDCSSTGINENYLSKLAPYPNPTNGILTIDAGDKIGILKVSVLNTLGQVVLTQENDGHLPITINIEGEAGIYFLLFETTVGLHTVLQVSKQ